MLITKDDYKDSKTIGIRWIIDGYLMKVWIENILSEISYVNGGGIVLYYRNYSKQYY